MPSSPGDFSLRNFATGNSTVEQVRQALTQAPANQLLRLQNSGTPVQFPAICPNCEQPAHRPLRLERAFILYVYQGSDSPNYTVPCIDAFDVHFCEACARQHAGQTVSPSPWTPLLRIMSDGQGFGGLVVIAISGLFFSEALKRLTLVPFFMGCFPLFIGLALIRPIWQRSRHMSLPRPTEVSLAFDFTPVLSLDHEPSWRAFYFRSPLYAAQFRQLNAAQLWDPQSPAAKSAATQRRKDSNSNTWIVGSIVAALVLWLILTGRACGAN